MKFTQSHEQIHKIHSTSRVNWLRDFPIIEPIQKLIQNTYCINSVQKMNRQLKIHEKVWFWIKSQFMNWASSTILAKGLPVPVSTVKLDGSRVGVFPTPTAKTTSQKLAILRHLGQLGWRLYRWRDPPGEINRQQPGTFEDGRVWQLFVFAIWWK